MTTEVVVLSPGRPAVPQDALEHVLNIYTQYEATRRLGHNRQPHRPRGPFLELMGRSPEWLRKYLKKQHLTWDTLHAATDDELLFFVTYSQQPYDCTWANPSAHRALGYTFDESYETVNGRKVFAGYVSGLLDERPMLETMRGGHRLEDHVMDEIARVRADPEYVGYIDHTFLVRCTDGWRVPIEIVELRYTNEWLERWVTIARVIDEPQPFERDLHGHADGRATTSGTLEVDTQFSNVDLAGGVLRLTKHDPSTIRVGRDEPLSLFVGPPDNLTRLFSGTPAEWKKLYEDLLPPYRPLTGGDEE